AGPVSSKELSTAATPSGSIPERGRAEPPTAPPGSTCTRGMAGGSSPPRASTCTRKPSGRPARAERTEAPAFAGASVVRAGCSFPLRPSGTVRERQARLLAAIRRAGQAFIRVVDQPEVVPVGAAGAAVELGPNEERFVVCIERGTARSTRGVERVLLPGYRRGGVIRSAYVGSRVDRERTAVQGHPHRA